MKKYIEILKKCRLFEGVDEESIYKMLGCMGAVVKNFSKNEVIFEEGISATKIGILLSGSALATDTDYFGNRNIFSKISPGELFYDEFACSGAEQTPVSVIACEDLSVMIIDCSHILYTCHMCCSHHQTMIFNLMKNLAKKNLDFHRRVEATSKRTTREKIITYLVSEAKRAGKPSFDIEFDRQQLADYLEVDRSGLSSEIGKLCREGLIENRKSRFTLL